MSIAFIVCAFLSIVIAAAACVIAGYCAHRRWWIEAAALAIFAVAAIGLAGHFIDQVEFAYQETIRGKR